jgi:hypothetical protein
LVLPSVWEEDVRPRIAIISRLSGKDLDEVEHNTVIARKLCSRVIAAGGAPFAAHLFYPEFLDDSSPREREAGVECGDAWTAVTDAAVVYVGEGVSSGMKHDIEHLRSMDIPIHEVEGLEDVDEALAWITPTTS